LIFHLTVKGLITPWSRWVWRFVFLCAGADYVVLQGPPSGSITLVLNWGKYFAACYIILSASRNHNARRAFTPSSTTSNTVEVLGISYIAHLSVVGQEEPYCSYHLNVNYVRVSYFILLLSSVRLLVAVGIAILAPPLP
jgi:hypothetical protein